ncbi:MAG: spore coat protein GerQ [Lactobacillales bacterium]|nr:spore coat protein GerQ [Lactobacillales bacterium]
MNNNYFGKPIFPNQNLNTNNQNFNTPPSNQNYTINSNYEPMALPSEQSYIENILRLNKGKQVRVHMTFPDSTEYRDREFKGIIEQSGRDHIILSEPSTGTWELLLMIYVNFISFDEPINYSEEFIPNN